MKKGKLILIPCTLGNSEVSSVLPPDNINEINSCNTFIVENLRSARRYLVKAGITTKIDDLHFHLLNKHTDQSDLHTMLNAALKGENIGLLSEAGCPGIADPGSDIVKLAHSNNIQVVPLVGPSSILLALMASGMNGQNFAFIGYLPKDKSERIKRIQFLENLSFRQNQTQIFIETPFRNNHMLEDLCKHCQSNTTICIATNLSTENEQIIRGKVKNIKSKNYDLNKKPSVFLIHKY
ncbi:MAG: SAM-dependent methyltransferase [Flavobacteriales bacterium]|nr:SAM-dependent methyltransferase [Flavobacteriales bacterium]MBL6873819.1 SAM-dependent methyltransferase [Flavobacteriales bacterium]